MNIYHWTPDSPQIEAMTTFGVSVKESDDAIGRFGTGFKYAVAGILRLGGTVDVLDLASGQECSFRVETATIRGRNFGMVVMNDQRLSFTTELGKHWEPWMLYRELESNTRDEGGKTFVGANNAPDTGTLITVRDCREYADAVRKDDVFISTEVAVSTKEADFHKSNGTSYCYYKGVRVGELPVAGYNVNLARGFQELTEDRTLKSKYSYAYDVRDAFDEMTFEECVEILNYNMNNEELEIRASCPHLLKMFEMKMPIPKHLSAHVREEYIKNAPPQEFVLDEFDRDMLNNVLSKVRRMGYKITCPIKFQHMSGGVLGMYKNNEIILTDRAFEAGEDRLLATVLEEHFHYMSESYDCTRSFQDFLIQQVVKQYNRSA